MNTFCSQSGWLEISKGLHPFFAPRPYRKTPEGKIQSRPRSEGGIELGKLLEIFTT
jgi:hypothetical protein